MSDAHLFFKLSGFILAMTWMAVAATGLMNRASFSRWMKDHVCPVQSPWWLGAVTAFFVLWAGVCCFYVMREARALGFLVALFLILGCVKAVIYLRHYPFMREKMVLPLFEGQAETALTVMLVSALAVGAGLMLLTILG